MKRVLFICILISIFTMISCDESYSSRYTIGPIQSDYTLVDDNNPYYEYKGYFPDGKLCFINDGTNYRMFWAESGTYMTKGSTTSFTEHFDKLKSNNSTRVIGYTPGQKNVSTKNNLIPNVNENGIWMIGIFPLDNNGKYDKNSTTEKCVGFFHTESHWSGDTTHAHKSICVAYSDDWGSTWHDMAPIIVDKTPKGAPENTGLGDGCVIRDEKNKRWICYYQGEATYWFLKQRYLCVAYSYDDDASSGTWLKYNGVAPETIAYNSNYSLVGENVAVPHLAKVTGANPSIMWNSYLNCYVMAYTSWTKKAYLSFSADGFHWSKPEYILGDTFSNPIWYVNLISDEGDLTGGKNIKMYFSYKQDKTRDIAHVDITFN